MAEKKSLEKRKYEKPAIIHEKKIEVLAAVCSSAYTGGQTCRTVFPTCKKLRT
jgi:hypothetical protein